jgi:hypothetical protein
MDKARTKSTDNYLSIRCHADAYHWHHYFLKNGEIQNIHEETSLSGQRTELLYRQRVARVLDAHVRA